jgi:ketosteroid isomerase-like protein
MSQENVEVVRRAMQRYADQDIDAQLGVMDPEVEFDWSNSDAPDSGVYTGRAGVRAFLEARDDALEERRLDFVQVIAPAPDTVVYTARMRERGRASGVEVTTRIALVWTLREGKVIRLTVYQTSDEALKAVGLAE